MKHILPSSFPGSALSAICLCCFIVLLHMPTVHGQTKNEENLQVFQSWMKWNNPGSFLINHLRQHATPYYERRSASIASLRSREDWEQRQQLVKDSLKVIFGEFPEKGPLNVKVTGTIRREDYRIDKMVFEPTPGYYVTGCLFVPLKVKGRMPAVLNVMGHDQPGFRTELYQLVIGNLVKRGIMVLAIDPPGQGEHVQYFDSVKNFSSVGYTVIEHSYLGSQNFLSGISPGKYFLWEAMRAIDYLLSRKDVDPARIGVTGFSGGGTISSYLAAYDNRIKVAVPCSWSTASERQMETKGIQDAETVFVEGIKKGISFEDLIEARAPKPTLLTFVTRDQYLSVQGAREAYEEIRKAYEAFGAKENIAYSEDDTLHWMTPKIRRSIYGFFLKHFNLPGNEQEMNVEILSPKELQVTPSGQIATSFGGKMIFDLAKDESVKLLEKLEASRKNEAGHLEKIVGAAKNISGFITPVNLNRKLFLNGRFPRGQYTVGKFGVLSDNDYMIPLLLFEPVDSQKRKKVIIYVHEDGAASQAKAGGEIEELVLQGYVVAAVDVMGIGETKHTASRAITDGYTGVLIGRSVVAVQAEDIITVAGALRHRYNMDSNSIAAVATGKACIPMIHAAAFSKAFNSISLIRPLASYSLIALNRNYKIGLNDSGNGSIEHPYEVDFSWGVANVLTGYDLPDLMAVLAPNRIAIIDAVDQDLEKAGASLVNKEMKFPAGVYKRKGAAENFRIADSKTGLASIVDWGFEK